MKKTIKVASILLVSLFFVTACGKKEEKIDYSKIMEEYSVDYYNEFQKGIQGITTFTISIPDLEKANEKMGKKYDLTKLEDCEKTSQAKFTVDATNSKIEKKEFEMKCEK